MGAIRSPIHRDKKGNEYRVCTKCDKLKPLGDYYVDQKSSRPDRVKHRARCKACEAEGKRKRESHWVRIPTQPLLELVDGVALERELSWTELGELLGVNSRTFYAWRHRERTTANLETADRILTGLGLIWEDVFDNKTCERLRAC